jgi:photosystem II stability/assembly factor-like uncharacterized protein
VVEPRPAESARAPGWDAERVWSGRDDWEPHVAADRGSELVYQLTTRYVGRPSIFFRRSSDRGATWEADRPLFQSSKSQYDPQVRVSDDGTVFTTWLETPGWSTRLSRSFDFGETWTEPVDVAPDAPYTDHGWLAVSPDGADVYVGVSAGQSYIAASHDSGLTFLPAVRTSRDSRTWFHTGGAVAPDGTVYFASADYSSDYRGASFVSVLRSTDGGSSWTTSRIDASSEAPPCEWASGCYLGFLGPTAGLAVDPEGRLCIAYNAGSAPNEPQALFARISLDGASWSPRIEIGHRRRGAGNVFPAVEAGLAAGDFRVAWQADEDGDPATWNTWFSQTTDGGLTWSRPLRLSDGRRKAPYQSPHGYRFPYGGYLGLAVGADGTNHVIWGEGSSYTGPGGTWYTRSR